MTFLSYWVIFGLSITLVQAEQSPNEPPPPPIWFKGTTGQPQVALPEGESIYISPRTSQPSLAQRLSEAEKRSQGQYLSLQKQDSKKGLSQGQQQKLKELQASAPADPLAGLVSIADQTQKKVRVALVPARSIYFRARSASAFLAKIESGLPVNYSALPSKVRSQFFEVTGQRTEKGMSVKTAQWTQAKASNLPVIILDENRNPHGGALLLEENGTLIPYE